MEAEVYVIKERQAKLRQLDSVWLKAAVIGGLWAAIEIIFGSFLHNLRIPFAGSILTFTGVSLLISFHRMWPEKGLIWRAGVICALMKSISPSSVILGPMSGIFFEALMLEAGLRLFRMNVAGYFLGAVLAMISTLVHKLISLLILYGWNIVKIYTNIYFFLSKQFKMEDANPWMMVWLVIGIYIILGVLSAYLGLAVGRHSKTAEVGKLHHEPVLEGQDDYLNPAANQKFHLYLLILHAIALPSGLILIQYMRIIPALVYITIYLVFCLLYYRNAMRRLKKPVFWFQLMMITLLAAVFWQGFNPEEGFINFSGLKTGLEMNLRAVFIVIGFSSLSVELRNPEIRDYLFRLGFGKIYLALNLSFGALPVMIKNMPRPAQFLKNPLRWFALINRHADDWIEVLKK